METTEQAPPLTIRRLCVIGLGGIGSWIVSPLIALTGCTALTLVDPDTGEDRNRVRQATITGQSKAACAADGARRLHPDLAIQVVERAATAKGDEQGTTPLAPLLASHDLVILAPDNHRARTDALAVAQGIDDCRLILAGNETDTGEVFTYIREEGKETTPNPAARMVADPAEAALSCTERLARGDTQTLRTNYFIGAGIILAAHRLIQGAPTPTIYMDASKPATRAA